MTNSHVLTEGEVMGSALLNYVSLRALVSFGYWHLKGVLSLSGLLWYYRGNVPRMMNAVRGLSQQPWQLLNSQLKTGQFNQENRLFGLMAFFHSFPISSSLPHLLFLVFLCLCLQCTWWRTGEETTRRTHA